ncbi:hypothetical protein S7711_10763 [Stachybotrys chartarum IBT 7711]|uniref:Uncharacterized protein n=1 Tax=Stachybotrys chartarum (strain CBS 109288 / IBT 7711) TaxID=1280523 RepID=A0A084AU65_STACB|nr:hypothetical protein S7711_10763 [Stachybotrys chartarum IBT 7711]KFA46965.1 hypothetical protein S40293_10725 [Stachybotrys chartarum IBT 40293]KFA81595.1 hypothetical protein S40288_11559 [Stachybotrys chartarum IBT 40288]
MVKIAFTSLAVIAALSFTAAERCVPGVRYCGSELLILEGATPSSYSDQIEAELNDDGVSNTEHNREDGYFICTGNSPDRDIHYLETCVACQPASGDEVSSC